MAVKGLNKPLKLLEIIQVNTGHFLWKNKQNQKHLSNFDQLFALELMHLDTFLLENVHFIWKCMINATLFC